MQFVVSVAAENGTVEGAGTYYYGDTVVLTAVPAEGYQFTAWSDGNTDNPREFVITENVYLDAFFELDNTSVNGTNYNNISIKVVDHRLVVEGATDYVVYSISGKYLGEATYLETGYYIVVVENRRYKVIVK